MLLSLHELAPARSGAGHYCGADLSEALRHEPPVTGDN
jgi:hypothetical protein